MDYFASVSDESTQVLPSVLHDFFFRPLLLEHNNNNKSQNEREKEKQFCNIDG